MPEAWISSPHWLARDLVPAEPKTLPSRCCLSKLRASGSPVLSQPHHLLCVSQHPTLCLLQDFVPWPSGTTDLWEIIFSAHLGSSSNILYPKVFNLDYLQGHNFPSCFLLWQLLILPKPLYIELGSGVAFVEAVDAFGALPRLVFTLGQADYCVGCGLPTARSCSILYRIALDQMAPPCTSTNS